MKPRKETIETQIKTELQKLEVGYHKDKASTFIHPMTVIADMIEDEPETIAQKIAQRLEENDVYNGYTFRGRKYANDYLNEFDYKRKCWRIDEAMKIALEQQFTFEEVAKIGIELLASIHANQIAQEEDEEAIEKTAERLHFILQTHRKIEAEEEQK
jgi:hypothetical protein